MAALLTNMTAFYEFVIAQLTNIINMILSNSLVYAPVLIALLGGIVLYVIDLVRKLGIKGISSGGRGRGRGRR